MSILHAMSMNSSIGEDAFKHYSYDTNSSCHSWLHCVTLSFPCLPVLHFSIHGSGMYYTDVAYFDTLWSLSFIIHLQRHMNYKLTYKVIIHYTLHHYKSGYFATQLTVNHTSINLMSNDGSRLAQSCRHQYGISTLTTNGDYLLIKDSCFILTLNYS